MIGAIDANMLRLLCALMVLSAYAYTFGQGHFGPGLGWFIASGVIGIGLADMAMFLAIKKIGARLSVLLVQCCTAPFGALVEWLWLGTILSLPQLIAGATIITGCGLALMPDKRIPIPRRDLLVGIMLGLVGAAGQAVGAVITRRGYEANALAAFEISAMTSGFQRMIGAILMTGLIALCAKMIMSRAPVLYPRNTAADYRAASPWVIANGLTGLVIGVSFLQWALKTHPTGIVLAIVATTPILLMPIAYLIEGDKPTLRAIIGAVVAVVGVIGLYLL